MTQETGGFEQEQQDPSQDQQHGDSPEAIEEQKAYGDSSAAVTPDTQQPPQGGGYGDATQQGDGFGGVSAEGESTVFGEESEQSEQSDPLAEQGKVEGQTSYGQDQDAEPSQGSSEQ